jgi:hypothetical protein
MACHLLLDQMWLEPHTFFWPFLGWQFPRENVEVIVDSYGRAFSPNPEYIFLKS